MALYPTATPSSGVLLSHLPAVFQGQKEEDILLRDFLAPFEEVLFGPEGLHSTVGLLADYLDARKARIEFLPWLASWMGTTLYRQLPDDKEREFVANASDYYRYRGTRHNLQRLLELFTGLAVHIDEPDFPMFQVGVHSSIGLDTCIEGGPPHVFRVTVTISPKTDVNEGDSRNLRERIGKLARRVIDLEKPVHTTYELELSSESEASEIGISACPPSE
jgi:phage tail protein domain